MRNLGEYHHRIADINNEQERLLARGVIKRIMKIDPTPQQQETLDADPAGVPSLAAAWRSDTIAATIVRFPRPLPDGTGCVHIGQLCAESRETMKKRGAAVEALLWTGQQYLTQRGWWLVSGLFGRRLYDAYYRKLMGIGGVELHVSEYRRLDTREQAAALALRISNPPQWLSGGRVGLDDGISRPFSLHFTPHGTILNDNGTAPLIIRGTIWPLLRWCASGRGKRDLMRTILRPGISLSGWWRRPITSIRIIMFLWRMGNTAPAPEKNS